MAAAPLIYFKHLRSIILEQVALEMWASAIDPVTAKLANHLKQNLASKKRTWFHKACGCHTVHAHTHTYIYGPTYILDRLIWIKTHKCQTDYAEVCLQWLVNASLSLHCQYDIYIYIYICTELWFAIPKNDLTIVRGAKVNPTKCRTMSHCQSTSKVCSRTVWSFTDRHWLQNKHHLTPGLCHAMPHACIDTQKGVVVLVMLSESCLSGQMPSFLSCLNALE